VVASVANNVHRFGGGRVIDLSRLNDAERGVLRLLAEGHTAKSIANALGSTPAAVNERLREARRKTGVGSSRELARVLKAQENRHEQMGVGKGAVPAAAMSPSGAEPWRPQTGVIGMVALFLIAAAGATALLTQQPAVSTEADPLVGTLPSGPDPATLHARIRAEPRDLGWAPSMEAAIRARAHRLPLIGKDGNVLRVTCATRLCEIAGTIGYPGPIPKGYDPELPQSKAQQGLQEDPFIADLTKLGLKSESGYFTGGQGKPDRIVFLLYYSRADAKPK
jgi:DNA-binding CsgD family transcriptional regulator